MLLPDLEAIEQVIESWLRSRARNSRQKERAVQPHPKPRVTQSARRLGALLVESLRRVTVRSSAIIALPDPQHLGLPLLGQQW